MLLGPLTRPRRDLVSVFDGPQEMDLSTLFTYSQLTETQEIEEEEALPAAAPQRQEIRLAARFSPADYEMPRAPASA